MAETGPVLMASRKIYSDGRIELWLGFDAGEWSVESRAVVRSRSTIDRMRFDPAAMDALVAGWTSFRAEIGN